MHCRLFLHGNDYGDDGLEALIRVLTKHTLSGDEQLVVCSADAGPDVVTLLRFVLLCLRIGSAGRMAREEDELFVRLDTRLAPCVRPAHSDRLAEPLYCGMWVRFTVRNRVQMR